MRSFISLLSLLSIFFTSCQEDITYQLPLSSPEGAESFTINVGQDTMIRTTSGMELEINQSSLITKLSKVTIQVTSVQSAYDLITNRLRTLTTNGKLLRTEGMLFIGSEDEVMINADAPIQVKVPTDEAVWGVKLFSGVKKDSSILWEEAYEDIESTIDDVLQNGKKLFRGNCAACHKIEGTLIGPGLAHVTKFRDSAFLVDFTKNSQGMIKAGHNLANYLYSKYYKQRMTSFPNLSVQEISDIYSYIEYVANYTEVTINPYAFPDPCNSEQLIAQNGRGKHFL
ncbi:MAG: cytochrome c [Bacteroidota bacterium]